MGPGDARLLTSSATPPPPLAMWTFEDGPRDQVGALHGQLLGGARIAEGRLVLDGTGYVRTPPVPVSLTAKTLVARVRVDPLTQGGGGVLTVQTPGGWVFDSIVYGEREPGKWTAGSDNFMRTRDLSGAPMEDRTGRVWRTIAVGWMRSGSGRGRCRMWRCGTRCSGR